MEGRRKFIPGHFKSEKMWLTDVIQEISQSWSEREPKSRCPVVIFLYSRSSDSLFDTLHYLPQVNGKVLFKIPLEQCFSKCGTGLLQHYFKGAFKNADSSAHLQIASESLAVGPIICKASIMPFYKLSNTV